MELSRFAIIILGTVGMLALMALRCIKTPQIKFWKIVIISFMLTIAGVAGAMLMFWFENGFFGGTSFFGAILFVPILILPAMLLGIRFGKLMDLCAPAECIMLAVLKMDCMVNNCCSGMYMDRLGFVFPSQIVEMITILLIMVVLLVMEHKGKKDVLYGWYLILYGSTRFILNWFRDGITPFALGLPAGNFWSIVAVAAGIMWLYIIKNKATGAVTKTA